MSPSDYSCMKSNPLVRLGAVLLMVSLTGCDKLGLGQKGLGPPEVPSDAALAKISYMSAPDSGPQGRKVYDHLWEAKTCGDLETAMRWNRPPNVPGGPFSKEMVYLTDSIPADLPKDSEVFLVGKIQKGDPLVAGGQVWLVKMKDGSLAQAAEMADLMEKQERETADSKVKALDKPSVAGRALCVQAVYQGMNGKDPNDATKKIPLFAVLYATDREK